MNRNEAFPSILVNALAVRLGWASVDVSVEDVEQIQVLVSGSDADVQSLRMTCAENLLTVEQPACGINLKNLRAEHWMQILIRLPLSWKGSVELHTMTAPIKVFGVTGTDLSISTVTGDMQVRGLTSITTTLRSLLGDIQAEDIQGETLRLRTLSGNSTVLQAGFDRYNLRTLSGQIDLDMFRPFTRVDGASGFGDVRLFAPHDMADAVLHTLSGRLRTQGVSIQPKTAPVRFSSISGHLEINCSTAATYNEEE